MDSHYLSLHYLLPKLSPRKKKLPFGGIQGTVRVTCLQPDLMALPMPIRMDCRF